MLAANPSYSCTEKGRWGLGKTIYFVTAFYLTSPDFRFSSIRMYLKRIYGRFISISLQQYPDGANALLI